MRAGMIELERSAQSAELASSAAPLTARACGSRRNAMRYLAACPVCAARPLFLTARHIQRGAPFLGSFPATGSACLCKSGKCKIKRPLAVTCRNSSTSYGTAHSCARGSSPCSERTSTGNDFQQQRQKTWTYVQLPISQISCWEMRHSTCNTERHAKLLFPPGPNNNTNKGCNLLTLVRNLLDVWKWKSNAMQNVTADGKNSAGNPANQPEIERAA